MSDLSEAQVDDLRRRIADQRLDAVTDLILGNAVACHAMVITGPDDGATLGTTRFGGAPDLPPDYCWPCDGDPDEPSTRFSNFVAQVNFAEIPGNGGLPRGGVLYLFVKNMVSAAEPVVLDALYFDGDVSSLRRAEPPDRDRLQDEYLVDLRPQRIAAVPSVSLPLYKRQFRAAIETATNVVGGKDGLFRCLDLLDGLKAKEQIGQLLGYANAGDIRENLYRQLLLARIGKRELTYNDYWDSMEEYEAYIKKWRDEGNESMVSSYEGMRGGVTWLIENREMIARGAAEWRLLLRIDSNAAMDLWINDADPLYCFIRDGDLVKRDFAVIAGEVTQG